MGSKTVGKKKRFFVYWCRKDWRVN